MFPDDYDPYEDGISSFGWITAGGFAPLDDLPGSRRRLHRQLAKEGFRRLQDETIGTDPNFNWMISSEGSLTEPNSISPPNLMNSTINANMTHAYSYAMFVTGENWGQGAFQFEYMTDMQLPYHKIDISWTDDPDGDLAFDAELTGTGGEWDDYALTVPGGKHYIIISCVFNPLDTDVFPPGDYTGNLYIDNVKYTKLGISVRSEVPKDL